MKFNRFALVAGVLALGAAACGDDVEIVQPTPAPPPPPPPVEATMAPASASVLIGNNVVFAVNASGGVAGDAASWTCASSNTGIATVSVVGSGCQATGVAAGDVTITASVTKSGETVNVGAQLTVTAEAAPETGDPAFLIVASITSTKGGDDGLAGTVTATVNVERGDQDLEKLSLLVDGAMVASQSFGGGMDMGMTPEPEDADAAAEQAVHAFTMSFNSAAYDDDGDPDYMNGEHTISAELEIGVTMADGMHGHETISSNVQTVTFNNADGYIVTADLGHNTALANDGARWYGGPDNGHIVISALGVSYSGEEAGAVKISLGDCMAEEGDGDGHGGAGVSVEFDCEDKSGTQAITVSAGGMSRTILNEDDLPEANIDMVAPTAAPIIIANRNDREDGWINAAVGISGEFHKTRGKDNWLVKGDLSADTLGVGGYNMAIRIGEDLEEAVGDDAMSRLPAESDDIDAYCAVAVATDNLGNMTELPDADDDECRTAPAGADMMLTFDPETSGGTDTITVYGYDADTDDDQNPNTWTGTASDVSQANSTLEFGVDTTAPTIELDEDLDMRFASETEGPFGADGLRFYVEDEENDDGNSGFPDSGGLRVKAERRTASKTECVIIGNGGEVNTKAAKDCGYKTITDETVNFEADSTSIAYYTVSGMAKDKAGNTSSSVSHTLVYDDVGATAQAPTAPPTLKAGASFTASAFVDDNFSIRDYYGSTTYGSIDDLGIGIPVEVDKFDAATFTNRNHRVSATVEPYAGLTAAVGTAPSALSALTVFVRDQAGGYNNAGAGTDGALTITAPADTLGYPASGAGYAGFADGAFVFRYGSTGGTPNTGYTVCGLPACGGDPAPKKSVTLQVRVQAADDTAFSEPFEMVDFWIRDAAGTAWKLGSDTSGTRGRVGGTTADARNRTWSYSLTVPGTTIAAATRSTTSTSATVLAIGVNEHGVGLVLEPSAANVTIDRTKPSN